MKWKTILLILLISSATKAAEQGAPYGNTSHVTAAPINPNVVAALIGSRIFVTRSGGERWKFVATALDALPVDAVQLVEVTPDVLFSQNDRVADRAQRIYQEIDAPPAKAEDESAVQFLIGVDDSGDVIYWESNTGTLKRCSFLGRCRALTQRSRVTALQTDAAGNAWLARATKLERIEPSGKSVAFEIVGIRQMLYIKSRREIAVLTETALLLLDEQSGKVRGHTAVPLGACDVAWFDGQLYALARDTLYRLNLSGSNRPFLRVLPGAIEVVMTATTVWLHKDTGWQKLSINRDSKVLGEFSAVNDVVPAADGSLWLATPVGPIRESQSVEVRYSDCILDSRNSQGQQIALPRLPATNPVLRAFFPVVRVRVRRTIGRGVSLGTDVVSGMARRAAVYVGVSLQWQFSPISQGKWYGLREARAQALVRQQQQRITLTSSIQQECARFIADNAAFDRVMRELRLQQLTVQQSYLGH